MTGPVVQSHGPDGILLDEAKLLGMEAEYELVYGKEGWRAPAIQEMRKDSMAKSTLMLIREIRSLRAQLAAKGK